ncbi:sulfatase [Reichenbachiella sp. MALMAid0571]|uniref:sulfatase family protein n=1 Tax=Reichenbachiella sp. MALMAid0571 TaxID=3143939 RepID=UPI0032DFF793
MKKNQLHLFRPLFMLAVLLASCETKNNDVKPNVLLITVDDMNYNSVGAFGAVVSGTTPNIDKLASQGMRFENAHVTIAVCQPSRGVLATGMYPHRSGIEGFFHTDKDIPTIVEILKQHQYYTGVLSKTKHSSPKENTPWDVVRTQAEHMGMGRDANRYYEETKAFLKQAGEAKKPFYLMANANDPHRPFSNSDQEKRAYKGKDIVPSSKIYKSDEIEVPAFLPDIPDVRLEMSEYYTSVRRADDVVGAVLKALEESGEAKNTLLMFLSDHGMALPFAKTNCYLNSTKTPWIVRWPDVVTQGSINKKHFISGIDFMPTVLEVLGIEIPKTVDGRSFVPLLKGEDQDDREFVFTQFHETSAKNRFPMRAVQSSKYAYIFNAWSDGERVFKNESQSGRTFKAMQEAAKTDSAIAQRVDLFSHRVLEEFYDLEKDPDALINLIEDEDYQAEIEIYRNRLKKWMQETEDVALEALEGRESKEKLVVFMEKEQALADLRKKKNKK